MKLHLIEKRLFREWGRPTPRSDGLARSAADFSEVSGSLQFSSHKERGAEVKMQPRAAIGSLTSKGLHSRWRKSWHPYVFLH